MANAKVTLLESLHLKFLLMQNQGAKRQTSVPVNHAAPEVFALPELLEMILVQTGMRDVLLWQRVNSTFQSVIARSRPIQEMLFFKIASVKATHIELNSLLANHFKRRVGNGATCYVSTARRRPSLEQQVTMGFQINNFDISVPRSHANLGSGSWRRMYFAQPSTLLLREMRFTGHKTHSFCAPTAKNMLKCIEREESYTLKNPERLSSLRSAKRK
ncbi:hypothetical protein LTR95_012530 [Oleoguttula sp. CCFEE 5521]